MQSNTVNKIKQNKKMSHFRLFITFMLSLHQKEEVTDWRKNVEAMSGMEGRKKLFDAGQ